MVVTADDVDVKVTNLDTMNVKLVALDARITSTGFTADEKSALLDMACESKKRKDRKPIGRTIKEDWGGVEFAIAVVVGIILIGIPLGCWIGTTSIGIFFQPWKWF